MRIGQGFDVHALIAGRRLVMGGVEIPHSKGLAGHSDADVLLHAICDALLRSVAKKVGLAGYRVVNVDATIIAQAPRMAPHVPRMIGNIATDLGVNPAQVSIKATTTEGLGYAGRGEGIAAQAIALIERTIQSDGV